MTRSNAREIAVHLIYAAECGGLSGEEVLAVRLTEEAFQALAAENEVYAEFPTGKHDAYIRTAVQGVLQRRQELDDCIASFAVGWRVDRISKLALAIMELAVFEARYLDDVPVNAAIHEAIVLAKKYEADETVSFINGVLGSFSRKEAAAPQEDPS